MTDISINAKLLFAGNPHDTMTVGDLRTFVSRLNGADPDDELIVSTSSEGAAFTIEGHVELVEADESESAVYADYELDMRDQQQFSSGYEHGYARGKTEGCSNGS